MRGAELTHHLLSYTRQQVLNPSLLELPGLLAEVRAILGRTLGSRVTLELAVEPAIARVRADRAQLQTALMNLAINAAHAMPAAARCGWKPIRPARIFLARSRPAPTSSSP